MRNPAFSRAARSRAPVETTIQQWLSVSGGASADKAGPMHAVNNPANRNARFISLLQSPERLAAQRHAQACPLQPWVRRLHLCLALCTSAYHVGGATAQCPWRRKR